MQAGLFERVRRAFPLVVPDVLQDITCAGFTPERRANIHQEIHEKYFPHLPKDVAKITQKENVCQSAVRVGVVLSGGPAPGGHNVISGLFDALSEGHKENVLIGFRDGPKGVMQNRSQVLSKNDIDRVRNTGGFCLLGTGRSKIATLEEMRAAQNTLQELKLDALVIVGGDDSNTDATYLAEFLTAQGSSTSVIGVPKTIDGDLQSEDIPISFGFDTACKVYSEIIGNIARDAISSKKYYYFIRLMGRMASHVTLECAMQVRPNLAIISEEVSSKKMTLRALVQEIADLVEQRYGEKKKYGLILIPEGVVEYLEDIRNLIIELDLLFSPSSQTFPTIAACTTRSEKLHCTLSLLTSASRECLDAFPRHIAEQLVYDRDPHGNVQVSRIETDRLLAHLVDSELKLRKSEIPFAYQTLFCGYEGRSAYPSFFDCHYCYALGKTAALLAMNHLHGYMAAVRGVHLPVASWEPVAVPLVSLMSLENRAGVVAPVMKKTLVDLNGQIFRQFSDLRSLWRVDDHYQFPGPIQCFGPQELVESICHSIVKK